MRMTLADYLLHQARTGTGGIPAGATDDESALHQAIIAELKRRGWYYVHSRMDRATTQQKGVPDFIIAAPGGKVLWIEAKAKGKKATPEQLGTIQWLAGLNHSANLVYSFDDFLKLANLIEP